MTAYDKQLWLCLFCAERKGGKYRKQTLPFVTRGECPVCRRDGQLLLPRMHFDWQTESGKHEVR